MAAVRDPAFWKRFSTAVHLDEEATTRPVTPATSSRPQIRHQDSWLDRQNKKQRKNRWMLCMFTLIFASLITIVALVFVWLSRHGWFAHGEKISFP